jgi:hypothetical protein
MPAFLRTYRKAKRPIFDEQVLTGGRDVDATWQRFLTVHRVGCPQGPRPVEDLRKDARAIGSDVQNDQDGGRKVGWKVADEVLQGLDAPGRGPHHDNVTPGHV